MNIISKRGIRRRGRIALSVVVATAGILVSGATFVASASASLSPATATFDLLPGTGTTETGKQVTLPTFPPSADVEIAIDTTGSMGGGIADAVSEANAIVSGVQASVANTDFALVQFKDYCSADGTTGPGCSTPGTPYPGDYPEYQVVQSMTPTSSLISTALGTLSAAGGGDDPEAHNLVFHNSYTPALGGDIGWRSGTRKFVVVISDAQPHGNLATQGLGPCVDTTNPDPNGLVTSTELAGMAANQRTLLMIHETDPGNTTTLGCYQKLASLAFSGGAAVDSGGSGLASAIVTLINAAFATVNDVHLEVDSASPSPADASWITLPSDLGPVAAPGTYTFGSIGINVPAATPGGVYTFDLVALADGIDVGHETITVNVPLITASGTSFNAVEGSSFSGTVATFTEPETSAPASRYTAQIDWGDGSPTSFGTVTGNGGSYSVSGSHTYAEEATYSVTVTITDTGLAGNGATASSTATVADAPITATCATAAFSLQSFNGTVASLGDTNAGAPPSDFTATINWGDGSATSPGTVTGSGGTYSIKGSHSYSSTGYYNVTTKVLDDGGSTSTAGPCSVLVFAFAPGRGAFVIGNGNSANGTAVTFWGAQWYKLNTLSGGATPAAFKGYALNPAVPSCGTGWSTDPGNSAPPPAGPLPAYMGVTVSSKITQSGSQISGNNVAIVVVKTNSGYAPDPGHAGTGTVVAQVC